MEWIEVAQNLCDGLDKDINDVAVRLKEWGEKNNLTPEYVDELCWVDSCYVFDQIYNFF